MLVFNTMFQVFISYNPSDDDSPICSWRWLLEYAFIPGSSSSSSSTVAGSGLPAASQHPQRHCYAFNFTAEAVVEAVLVQQHDSTRPTAASYISSIHAPNTKHAKQQKIQQTLKSAGLLGSSFWVEFDGLGRLPEGLLDWMGQILSTLMRSQQLHNSSSNKEGLFSEPSGPQNMGTVCQQKCGAVATSSSDVEFVEPLKSDTRQDDEQGNMLRCVARCVLQHMLREQQQVLQNSISHVQQQLQQQRTQSCLAAAAAAPAEEEGRVAELAADGEGTAQQHSRESTDQHDNTDLQQQQGHAAGSCVVNSADTAEDQGQPSLAAANAAGLCDLHGLLTVAVDGGAALQATLNSLR